MLNNNIKIDLHIHSKASEYKEREGYVADSNIDNIDVLLKNVEDNKVNMISITDHNRFDYELYKKIKSVINKPPYEDIKNILPGVEFDVMLEESSTTSCHIICIFDDCNDKKIENIQSKINEVRILESESDYYKLEEFENILYKVGTSVVLIAHQKSGIDVQDSTGKHHSLSEAVKDPNEWIRIGYINALEYQKPRIQGMIKNNLKEINTKFATITGSDCHVWSAYPNKDSTIKTPKEYLSKVKCLPTFKGLLLALSSPETRFERKDEGTSSNYINQIKLGENNIELSTGINAIIGENGSGKSYILGKINGENEKKYKKIGSVK